MKTWVEADWRERPDFCGVAAESGKRGPSLRLTTLMDGDAISTTLEFQDEDCHVMLWLNSEQASTLARTCQKLAPDMPEKDLRP